MSERGREIEAESFRRIEALLPPSLTGAVREIHRRIIHATADPSYTERLRIHPRLVRAFVEARERAATIFVDVEMLRVAVAARLYPGAVRSAIAEPETRRLAEAEGITRSAAAFRRFGEDLEGQIVAVGNAPTALREVSRLIRSGIRPALVIGVPVGFVDAAEAKEELLSLPVPYLTSLGPQGGTPVAAAALNALIRLGRFS